MGQFEESYAKSRNYSILAKFLLLNIENKTFYYQ